MTRKQRIVEELEVKCPFCSSDHYVSVDYFDNGEDRIFVTYTCINCNEKFEVTFRDILVAETIVDVNGKIIESIYN